MDILGMKESSNRMTQASTTSGIRWCGQSVMFSEKMKM